MPNPPPDESRITTLAELLWYIRHYERDIFFRAERDGKMGPVAVADLTPEEYGEHIAHVVEQGVIPVRVDRGRQ